MDLAGMTTDPPMATPQLETEIQRIQQMIDAPKMREIRRPNEPGVLGIRPRNAATMILVDRSQGQPRVLMGRRHHSLKFMPGALVFPGGSVDRSDGGISAASELPTQTSQRIVRNLRGRPTLRAARALGMAAIREVAEETGLLIGVPGEPAVHHPDWLDFSRSRVIPSLAGFSLLARAITPPGPPRRFDTWFFITDIGAVAHTPENGFQPSGELEALEWVSPQDAIRSNTREITRVMLVELMNRLETDPELRPDRPAPYYRVANSRFLKSMI